MPTHWLFLQNFELSSRGVNFLFVGREAAKRRTIDRYNWVITLLRDTESLKLSYDCTDEELVVVLENSEFWMDDIPDSTIKQKLDSIGYPVGIVYPDGKLRGSNRSSVPLRSPVEGEIFSLRSNVNKWRLSKGKDIYAFPLSLPGSGAFL